MKPRVLIVDDSATARLFLRRHLPLESIDLREATNGQEAISQFEEFSPDIMFLDLTMPIMDGFEALERIMGDHPEAKVIVLTSDVQQRTIERIRALGAYRFLKKPPRESEVHGALLSAVPQLAGAVDADKDHTT